MGTYLRPCGDVTISSSWQAHKDRNPPSSEPGTDYAVAKGTPVQAATDGVIADVKTTTSTATGRYVALRADDGNYLRYLHLQSAVVSVGQRVSRGQVIAYSGASGFGSEDGYGAHVHVTLWIGDPWVTPTVDFTNYIGNPEPEEEMPEYITNTRSAARNVGNDSWTYLHLNDNADTTFAVGGRVTVVSNLVISGLAVGATLQARYVAADSVGDADPTSLGAIEIVGTSGSTLGQIAAVVDLSTAKRLRLQVIAFTDGVKVDSWNVRGLHWT